MVRAYRAAFADALQYLVLAVWALIVIFPLYWLVTTSFKPPLAVSQGPKFIPWVDFRPTLEAWRDLLVGPQSSALRRALGNSAAVSLWSTLIVLVLGAAAAYGLARFSVRVGPVRNADVLTWMVSQRMMPPIVAALGLFVLLRKVGLLDTRLGLVIVYAAFNLPLAVWLLHGFFQQVPAYLEEAAMVDGATRLQALVRVVLPLTVPGFVANFLFVFMLTWNEFLFPLILTFDRAQTLPILIAMQHSQRGVEWWSLSAMSIITLLPTVVITVLLNRFLVLRLLIGAGK